MSKVGGKIDIISKNKSGIKIGGNWYNLPIKLQGLKLMVGQYVNLDLMDDNKTVRFVHFDTTNQVPLAQNEPLQNQNQAQPVEEHIFDESILTEIGRHWAEIWKLSKQL